MKSFTKNPNPKTKKMFCHIRLVDLLSLFRIWTALQHNQQRSYACTKTRANYWF